MALMGDFVALTFTLTLTLTPTPTLTLTLTPHPNPNPDQALIAVGSGYFDGIAPPSGLDVAKALGVLVLTLALADLVESAVLVPLSARGVKLPAVKRTRSLSLSLSPSLSLSVSLSLSLSLSPSPGLSLSLSLSLGLALALSLTPTRCCSRARASRYGVRTSGCSARG